MGREMTFFPPVSMQVRMLKQAAKVVPLFDTVCVLLSAEGTTEAYSLGNEWRVIESSRDSSSLAAAECLCLFYVCLEAHS